MCHRRMPKPKSQVSLVPDTLSPCMGSITHLHYQSTIKLSKGQFIVRHIRPYYGFMLP